MDMGVWWFEFIVKYLGEAVLAEVVSSVMDMVPAVVAVVNPGAGEAPPGSQDFEKISGWGGEEMYRQMKRNFRAEEILCMIL